MKKLLSFNELFEVFKKPDRLTDPDWEHTLDKPSTTLIASLKKLGKDFNGDKEIISAIESLGFEQHNKSGNERTAEYIFYVIGDKYKKRYISYTSGHVRYMSTYKSRYHPDDQTSMGRVSRSYLGSSTDRLLLILKAALKHNDLYHKWKKSNLTVKDFLHTYRGMLKGREFNI